MTQAEKDALIARLKSSPHVVNDLVGTLATIVSHLPVNKPRTKVRPAKAGK